MDLSGAVQGLLGGVLIGLAGAMLLLFNGRIAGIAGILAGFIKPAQSEWTWRAWFVAGLLGGGALVYLVAPGQFAIEIQRSWPLLVLGGLLVGFGSRLGSGCTSGHGVCGLSRFSARSWVATAVFTGTGALTVYVLEHLIA